MFFVIISFDYSLHSILSFILVKGSIASASVYFQKLISIQSVIFYYGIGRDRHFHKACIDVFVNNKTEKSIDAIEDVLKWLF